jgi:hypothetical protein
MPLHADNPVSLRLFEAFRAACAARLAARQPARPCAATL